MKDLYSFTVDATELKKVEEKTLDENGNEVVKTTNKKEVVKRKVVIQKPNRRQNDDAEMLKAKKYSRYLADGILSRSMLLKKHSDNGGIITKLEQETYAESVEKIREIQVEIQKYLVSLNSKKEEELTEEQRTKLNDFSDEIRFYQEKINDIEQKYSNEFSNTAEALSERDRIKYLIFTLSFWEKDEKLIPIYEGKTYEDKYDSYCKLEDLEEESEEFKTYAKALKKINIFLTFYAQGRAIKREQFEFLDKTLDQETAE